MAGIHASDISSTEPQKRLNSSSVIKQENKKLYSETIDPDATRRQAITALSSAMLNLQVLKDLGAIGDAFAETFDSIFADLTRSRYLLVAHANPVNVLDELSQL